MRSRRMAAVAAWTVTVVLLTGCSEDEPERSEEPRPSGSATTTSAPDGSEDPSAAPSTADVEPATGQQVAMRSGTSFRFTEGPDWGWDGEESTGLVADAEVDEARELVLLEAREVNSRTDDLEVAADVALSVAEAADRPTLRREEDREVNGVTGYVLRSENDESNFYLFGALHEATSFSIEFEVPLELDLEDWVEPILASIEWS